MRSEVDNAENPYAGRGVERAGESPWGSLEGELPTAAHEPGAEFAVGALAGYLARLCGRDGFHVGYRTAAGDVPLRVLGDLAAMRAELADARRRPAADASFAVAVAVADDTAGYTPGPGTDLAVAVSADGAACRWRYRRSVYADDDVRAMQAQLVCFAEALAAAPSSRFDDVPILSAEQVDHLTAGLNQTAAAYPDQACVHELIEAQVDRMPDAPAVAFREREISYAELDRRANRLATYLRGLGVGPGERVGVFLDRSIDMVVALLGVLKAGGAYIPLDPQYPLDRLGYVLEDAGPAAVLTTAAQLDRLPSSSARVVVLDREAEAIERCDAGRPTGGARSGDLAYCIYTSGSTGRPKGVMVCHRNVSNLFAGMDRHIDHDAPGTWLAVGSISFDISVLELFWSLARGFKIVLYPGTLAERGPEDSIAALLERHAVSHFQCTPSMASMLVADEHTRRGFAALRNFLIGGEALPPALAAQLLGLVPDGLINVYGPTETTVWSTAQRVREVGMGVPIGRPLLNQRVYVLDARLRPVPVGVPGELFIAGAGVTPGYHNRPELTAERFLPDPFTAEPDARMYRTGDLARWRADGVVEYLGRTDFQVKIRGHRIELGEIEARLGEHPSVRETVVIAREDTPGDQRLVAYVVPPAGQECDTAGLRAFLKSKLPEYMLPSHIVVLEKLPQTPNAKVDRKALPAPDAGEAVGPTGSRVPTTPLEEQVVALWADVLRVSTVGLDDDFFALGGHSLIAVRLFARIRDTFGVELPLATIFRAPTAAACVRLIEEARESSAEAGVRWSPLVPISPNGSRPPLFCVHPSGGNVLIFHDLARLLGSDQPFFGLQARGVDGKMPPIESIEEMAEQYVAAIRLVQPSGPYHLGGHSSGGVVAFEMARQLAAQGEQVAFLGIMDSLSPLARELPYRVVDRLTNVKRRGAAWALGWPRRFLGRLSERARVRWRRWRRLPMPLELSNHLVEAAHDAAEARYVGGPFDGKATLFSVTELHPTRRHLERDLGWAPLVASLEIVDVPGDHDTLMLQPTVRGLAERLDAALRRAQELTAGAPLAAPEELRVGPALGHVERVAA
jgi:amino acid adenylation domain-containing protein